MKLLQRELSKSPFFTLLSLRLQGHMGLYSNAEAGKSLSVCRCTPLMMQTADLHA